MAEDPRTYQAVTVSSTFTDLKTHRREVCDALAKFDLFPKVMEFNGARADADVIDSSLGFVRDSSAFIGIISHKYGQTPKCPVRNRECISISELEFNKAMELDRPILLFVMAENHPVTLADVEQDPEKLAKLQAFKARAKKMRKGSEVNRIYETFDSPEDFAKKSAIAVGRLAELLKRQPTPEAHSPPSEKPEEPALPAPPELRAMPRYMGSHAFVGRASELQALNDWAGEADPDPMLLFEAIGGSGKSMLTWAWVTNHAVAARNDWAGRFWYSFYERGALMTDFCREALTYMTGQPLDDVKELRIRELSERLILELERRPWLMVLDGLERVLVAYHRSDAAQLRDEEADISGDQIADRDPCAAIRPEDDDLLRHLAVAKTSKILVTSRLTPRALINPSNMPLPGVRRKFLEGLSPPDAEALMRSANIRGDSKAIRDYVQRHCGCHPLVVGILAGLVNNHMADQGNFDAWLEASDGGRSLNLGDFDLVRKREHILDAAIRALLPEALRLLQTLALLQRGADYELLTALNPHLSAESKTGEHPSASTSSHVLKLLNATIRDLERRGLLQYERGEKRYDLHPVVRGVAAGRMNKEERDARGDLVVSYFTSQSPDTWDHADSLDDLAPGRQLVATLTQIGRFEEACNVYQGGLDVALFFNCQAHVEILALLRPFFPEGWDGETVPLEDIYRSALLNAVANSLDEFDPPQALRLRERMLRLCISLRHIGRLIIALSGLSISFENSGKLAVVERIRSIALDLANACGFDELRFRSSVHLFALTSIIGKVQEADQLWAALDPMARLVSRRPQAG